MRRLLLRSPAALHEERIPGGAGRLMLNISRALSEHSWRVDLLCPEAERPRSLPDGVSVQEFSYPNPTNGAVKLLDSVRGARTFRRLTQRHDYNVVLDDVSHVPFYPAHFLAGDTTNALFVHTAFFGAARRFVGPAKGTVVDLIDRTLPYLRSPEIICAGQSTESNIHETLKYHQTRVLNPCIDLDAFDYRFDPDSRRLLYLGRLTERKNVGCLLEAWRQLESHYPDHELVIAGTGPREEALRTFAKTHDLSVDFRGFVDETEKRRLYRESLLFVFPSLLEGYATTGLEAMASGTPVVGSDTAGINDYVSHGENGFLFARDDSAALAATLDDALAEPMGLEPLARRGRQLAENHSFESFACEADRVFSELA